MSRRRDDPAVSIQSVSALAEMSAHSLTFAALSSFVFRGEHSPVFRCCRQVAKWMWAEGGKYGRYCCIWDQIRDLAYSGIASVIPCLVSSDLLCSGISLVPQTWGRCCPGLKHVSKFYTVSSTALIRMFTMMNFSDTSVWGHCAPFAGFE